MFYVIRLSLILVAAMTILMPSPAQAYIGPGAGIGAIAITVAFLVGAILLFVGLVWFPLKRLLKRKNRKEIEADESN